MKTNPRKLIAIAIIVIASLSAIAVIRSSAYPGSEAPSNQPLSITALNVLCLVAVGIYMTGLFYIISKVLAWHIANKSTPQPTATSTPKVFTAPIVAKVKSHPLPPLWR